MTSGLTQGKKRKRPVPVWILFVIQIWLGLIFVMRLYWPLLLYQLGSQRLTDAERTFFSRTTFPDLLAVTVVAAGFTAGAIALFALKRWAFYLYLGALIVRLVFALARIPPDGFSDAFGAPNLATVFAWGLPAALCLYSWFLLRRGVLT